MTFRLITGKKSISYFLQYLKSKVGTKNLLSDSSDEDDNDDENSDDEDDGEEKSDDDGEDSEDNEDDENDECEDNDSDDQKQKNKEDVSGKKRLDKVVDENLDDVKKETCNIMLFICGMQYIVAPEDHCLSFCIHVNSSVCVSAFCSSVLIY